MKIRRLAFEKNDDGRKFAALLYQGFTVGGNVMNRDRKGPEITRKEAGILRKFRKIGAVTEDGTSFELRDEAETTLLLTVPEFEMLKNYFEATPWATRLSIDIEDIMDWLSTAPTEDNDG